jgi:hypothetical protein
MPSKQEFKDNLGLSWGVGGFNIGNEKSPFPALTRIGKLIEEYETVVNDDATKLFIQFQIERSSRFAIHNRFNKDKIGGELGNRQTDFLQSLREYVLTCVQNTIGANDGNYEEKLVEAFGKEVCNTGQDEDQRLLNRDAMLYYRTALEQ